MFKIVSTSIVFFSSILLFSQTHDHSSHLDHSNMREGEHVEYCKTHKFYAKMMGNADFVQQNILDQQALAQQEQVIEQENLNKAGTVYKIPIVFHVLHNGGSENISRAQIMDALRILNRDYRLQNADANNVVSAFQGMPTDIEIEFVLATIAPNGQCFSGITRTMSPRTEDTETDNYDGEDQVNAIVNGNDVYQGIWDPSKYLNIYICKSIGGAAGYTTYPSNWNSGDMVWNGIFVLHNYVGSIGTSSASTSRTLTHECGHWLNLIHPWGNSNNPGLASNCSIDDGVSDTPNTKGVTSCNLSESSCGVLANVENYMDYSYCSKMFTAGQRTRMRAAITSSVAGRSNLWKTSNLNATGANGNAGICKADFSVETKVVCVGTTIDFTDDSYHNPTSWSWTFQGGTPSSSSTQNPSITYNTPGIYPVSLTVNGSTGSASETKTQYIKVVSETGIPPIQEGFEFTNTIPSNNWFVENLDNGVTWELTNVAAASGSNCVMINNSQNNEGSIDELESTTITLDLNLSATISFDYAFAKKNSSNSDRLLVKVSNNCGQTWNTKKTVSGGVLETAPNTSGNFVPDATQWKTATINSSSLVNYLDSDFRMKFIFEHGGGNNIYIDNINISGPVSIDENESFKELSIYPNPAKDEVNVTFSVENNQRAIRIELLDLTGKVLESVYEGGLQLGEHQFQVNTKKYAAGMYILSFNDGENTKLSKLIIE
ncbi:MAG: M43 family zinc metalloprotease [Flavobacteriales bacterium]|jgi:PKD repeat protein|nr:M43 family zinc metalloprotease [Flavobacteriales bacterium]